MKKPVTRSKGGWRRKPRRITPHVIKTYWPAARVRKLRRLWPDYVPVDAVVERLNAIPGPKPVTIWQTRMMAAHLDLRRPPRVAVVDRITKFVAPEHRAGVFRILSNKHEIGPIDATAARPESKTALRKVGRKRKTAAERLAYQKGKPKILVMRDRRTKTPTEIANAAIRARYVKMRRMVRQGWRKTTVAKAFGVNLCTVYRAIHALDSGQRIGKSKRALSRKGVPTGARRKQRSSAPSHPEADPHTGP